MNRLICQMALAFATTAPWASEPVPDFHLVDVNPNSQRSSAHVSPRDYLLQVSGFYFGHAG